MDKATEQPLRLPAPCGVLEVRYAAPTAGRPVAVICHPHPLFGGSLDNKVVFTLMRSFQQLGLGTLRFNFRGVGASSGHYDDGRGELDDLAALCRWLAQQGNARLWLAGFSFGAYIAARGCQAAADWGVTVEQLILVAPPVRRFDFSPLQRFDCPVTLLQGEADELVTADGVAAWAEQLHSPHQLLRFADCSHFFHGQLVELRSRLVAALAPTLVTA